MTSYHYVLTLQLRGYDPVTYKGVCDLAPPVTSSGLLDYVTREFLKAMGRPNESQYSVLFWFVGPEVLEPAEDLSSVRARVERGLANTPYSPGEVGEDETLWPNGSS